MIFLTSDQHYGHNNILRYVPERPFSTVADMNKELVQRHNHAVKPGDTVIHLGDFAFGSKMQVAAYLARLNGTHIIIRGNHDRGFRALEQLGFALAVPELRLVVNCVRVLLTHRMPTAKPDNADVVWHGHVHIDNDPASWRLNLCVENTGYRPMPLSAVLKMWRRKRNRLSPLPTNKEKKHD